MVFPTIYPVTSHTLHVGPGSTFVAIDGFKQSGVAFIEQAIERGATTIVADCSWRGTLDWVSAKNVSVCFVSDCRKSLAELSCAACGNPSRQLSIIGITGTKGKTSTAFLVEHMLRHAGYNTALIGSINNRILDNDIVSDLTTPGSDYLQMFLAQCVKQGVSHVVMEVSSHAIALKRTHGTEFFAVGFTNLAPEHMDFHSSMEQYFATKTHLFSQVKKGGFVLVNRDDAWGEKIAQKKRCAGMHRFEMLDNNINGLTIALPDDDLTIKAPSLFGEFNAYNIFMAYTICRQLRVDKAALLRALNKIM